MSNKIKVIDVTYLILKNGLDIKDTFINGDDRLKLLLLQSENPEVLSEVLRQKRSLSILLNDNYHEARKKFGDSWQGDALYEKENTLSKVIRLSEATDTILKEGVNIKDSFTKGTDNLKLFLLQKKLPDILLEVEKQGIPLNLLVDIDRRDARKKFGDTWKRTH